MSLQGEIQILINHHVARGGLDDEFHKDRVLGLMRVVKALNNPEQHRVNAKAVLNAILITHRRQRELYVYDDSSIYEYHDKIIDLMNRVMGALR